MILIDKVFTFLLHVYFFCDFKFSNRSLKNTVGSDAVYLAGAKCYYRDF